MAEKRNYHVYKITNDTPSAKKKTYYIVSSIGDKDKVKAMVRGMATSSTAKGGAKALSSDMKSQGKAYKDNFSITSIRSGMSKHDATLYRNSLKSKSAPGKAYNKPR